MDEKIITRLELYISYEHADIQIKLIGELALLSRKLPEEDRIFAAQKAGLLFNNILAIRILKSLSDKKLSQLNKIIENSLLSENESIKIFLQENIITYNNLVERCYISVLDSYTKIIKRQIWRRRIEPILSYRLGALIVTIITFLLFKFGVIPIEYLPKWFIYILKHIGIM